MIDGLSIVRLVCMCVEGKIQEVSEYVVGGIADASGLIWEAKGDE